MNLKDSRYWQVIIALLLMVTYSACKKNDPAEHKQVVKKMVLVYMEANNDLRYDALNSINMMERGAAGIDGTLLVYIKTETGVACLLKIKPDSDGNKIVSDTVKVFSSNQPSDPAQLKNVISYAQQEFPAETYGLVLWSHATSWAPPASKVKVRSFGSDAGKEMDIIDLKNALPDNLEFLIFDACSMGAVEVLYEFRNKARYIIASPTETLAESFPYQTVTPYLFNDASYLPQLAKAYYDHYNAFPDDRRSATVVLVKTSELAGLAEQMKVLIQKQKSYGDLLVSAGVQRLDYTAGFPVPGYDFGDYLIHNFRTEDLTALNAQFDRAIVYKAATPSFLGVLIQRFSGVSCYIPGFNDPNLAYYKRLSWYKDSGLSLILGN